MRIESGPTGERKVRTSLLFLMVAIFSAWFAYDGWIGYPKSNYKEHIGQLSREEREAVGDLPVYPTVTQARWESGHKAIKEKSPSERRAALEQLFEAPPSYENAEALYYFGPAYRVKATLRDGQPVEPLVGSAATKSETSIQWQLYLAAALAMLSVYLLWFVIGVVRTHAVLDDSGLTFNGRGPIAWDQMKRLDISRFNEKGWVDLYYDVNGTEERLRLDEYHLALFDDFIDEICVRKGFENPLPMDDKSAESEKA